MRNVENENDVAGRDPGAGRLGDEVGRPVREDTGPLRQALAAAFGTPDALAGVPGERR